MQSDKRNNTASVSSYKRLFQSVPYSDEWTEPATGTQSFPVVYKAIWRFCDLQMVSTLVQLRLKNKTIAILLPSTVMVYYWGYSYTNETSALQIVFLLMGLQMSLEDK